MIKIIDTSSKIETLFDNGNFNIEKWQSYINSVYESSASIFKEDLREAGYSYEKDILPILNAVYNNPKSEYLHSSFYSVTEGLNEKINCRFRCELDVDVVLYMGLCNAAGWVTAINGRDVILLGIEKILELDWCDIDSMHGLIYHELGHVYHKQHGNWHQTSADNSKSFVWQLFCEGIAMCFEQDLIGDPEYFHQNRCGWKEWCDTHYEQILSDFHSDLRTMTRSNQRYFGDWVSYRGKGDVGYYLGARLVRHLLNKYSTKELINMDINEVYKEYLLFAKSN